HASGVQYGNRWRIKVAIESGRRCLGVEGYGGHVQFRLADLRERRITEMLDDRFEESAFAALFHAGKRGTGERRIARTGEFACLNLPLPCFYNLCRYRSFASLSASVNVFAEVGATTIPVRRLPRTRRYEFNRHRSSSRSAAQMRSTSFSVKIIVRPA